MLQLLSMLKVLLSLEKLEKVFKAPSADHQPLNLIQNLSTALLTGPSGKIAHISKCPLQ